MIRDLRHAARTLLRAPGYSVVSILALALGVGAATTIFSFVDTVLLRPLPYPQADRIVAPVSVNPSRGFDRASVTYADYEDWKREADIFDAVALVQSTAVDLSGRGDPERVPSANVSEDFFRLASVTPVVGRPLVAEDYAPSAPRVAVIGHGLWQRRFGGDPTITGAEVRIGGVPHVVVGVLPARASWPEETELFLPLRSFTFNEDVRTRRDNMIFQGLARLADGVTIDQARARVLTIARRLEQEHPESRQGWSNDLLPLHSYIVQPEMRTALVVLFAAVAAVLLIVCANLASLTLVRSAGRAREMGVRSALGASRWRLLRHLLAESALIGAVGGLSGIGTAFLLVDALVSLAPRDTPFVHLAAVDGRVLMAATAMILLTVALSGVLPALSASGVSVADTLKQGGRGSSQGTRATRVRQALVVAEIAAAVVLLVGAGLLVRSLERLTRTSPGADVDRVIAGRVALPPARYPTADHRVAFYRELVEGLQHEPGVEAATATSYLPAGGGGFGLGRVFLAEGRPEPPAGTDVPAMWTVVTPEYFRALGIPLRSGRTFDVRDDHAGRPVVIISQRFADLMFPGEDPIGRRVRSWRDENVLREIVGVVGDVPFERLTDRTNALVYVPHAQQGWGTMTVALRAAAGRPESLAGTLRRSVSTLDPELALANIGTMEVFAHESVARERVSAVIMGSLSSVALGLAVLGIYGVMSYAVSQRREEMGVRLALGASPGSLYRLVLGAGMGLTVTGVLIGLVLALAASSLFETLLFEVSPLDPVTFSGMVVLVAASALMACTVPAHRAAAADPVAALRSE